MNARSGPSELRRPRPRRIRVSRSVIYRWRGGKPRDWRGCRLRPGPVKNTRYQGRFAGGPETGPWPCTWPAASTRIRVRVSLDMATTGLELSKSRMISGVVVPARAGKVEPAIGKPGVDAVGNLPPKGFRYGLSYKRPAAGTSPPPSVS